MKRLLLALCCLTVLAFAGTSYAAEPAILADLDQSFAVQQADEATLDAAQGANITEYKVRFNYGDSYMADARSRKFSNWTVVSGPTSVYTQYSGTWYVSHNLSQVIWNQSNSPVTQWCTSR